jgi:alkylation response protein AidB-like acyl-CoA dehydrogenase
MSKSLIKGCEYLLNNTAPGELFTPEDFSDEQRQIADTTEQFVKNDVLPHVEEIDQQDFNLAVDLMHKSGELGLLMAEIPEEYGGLELDKASGMLVAEKMGATGAFATTFMAHTGIGTLPLVYYGTAEQKGRYLDKLGSGEWLAAYCLTEPDSGSDALGAKATATLSEDGSCYILNGTKQFITNAAFADLFTVFAKIDKEHFTGFLVEKNMPGVSLGNEEKKLGIKGSSTRQLILDNVRVPRENLLGEIGKGHKIAFNVLNVGRIKLGAGAVGASKIAFAAGAAYANERKQFGRSIASFGAIREKLADMTAGIFASESIVYRLAGLIDSRIALIDRDTPNYYEEYQKAIEEYAAECAISKVFCSEVVAAVVDEVLQIHGGYGFVSEYPAERFYRDARISRIYEGTNEINRILIPGTILRKGMKGELPLMEAIRQAATPGSSETPPAGQLVHFVKQEALLQNLKTLFMLLAGSALQKYQEKVANEQEVLLALADVAIQIYALESAVLRAEKAFATASDSRKGLLQAVVEVCTFDAVTKLTGAAQRGAVYVSAGEELARLHKGIHKLSTYDASGLLQAKQTLADAVRETEKYLF